MAKKTNDTNIAQPIPPRFERITRMVVPVDHRKIDDTEVTEQGKEQKVSKLFEDYVLGRLDLRQLGGGSFDAESSEEVDPFNDFGITFERMSEISDAGRKAAAEVKQRAGSVADHPIESNKPQEKEEPPAGTKNGSL